MELLEGLNEPQKEAVLYTDGPLLILAGAGSGKTRVLTHRIAFLISQMGISPWNILAITFTNKAAREMRERVDRIVGMGSEAVWVSTFHSCCVRILRRHIDRLGYSGNFVIYDTDDQKSLMKEIFQRQNINTKVYKEKGILAKISHAKEEGTGPSEYEKEARGEEELLTASLYREYQRRLQANNALDFDDLLVKTVELFEQYPEILADYQERFRYIMVDEYQDTNNIQFRFVSLLASRYRNLCVVGDDDQSIYRFRGANIYNILDFEDTFPETKVIRLEQNYRSTQNILEAANSVIRNNTERKEKTLWTENEPGSLIHFRQFMNGFEEAEYVAGEISSAHRSLDADYRDFAILYRTNAQSRMFEEKFVMSGIPYKIVGGVNFYARKEIKDLVCYLRTVANATDDLAVNRIVNVPRRGIGAATLTRVSEYAVSHGLSQFQAMENAREIPGIGRSLGKLEGFVRLIRVLRTKADDLSVSELLEEIIHQIGYVEDLEAEGTEESQARIENIDELISTAVSYEELCKKEGSTPSLSGFLEEIALVADVDSVDEEDNHVLLMTLHSAKGLEFSRVFMVGMDEGIFPGQGTVLYGDDSDMEEERRLCYVGITRAKQDLTMTSARSRMLRGKIEELQVSRFVKEVPRDLVETGQVYTDTRKKLEQMRSSQIIGSTMKQVFSPALKRTKPENPGKPASLDYGPGDQVLHVKFGYGTVISIVDGGRDYEVTVDFEKYGTKKMFAGFARLRKC